MPVAFALLGYLTLHGQPATRVHVEDNGIGIAPGQQEQIFIMFQWLHSQERYPGTGVVVAERQRTRGRAGQPGVIGCRLSAIGSQNQERFS